MFVLATKFDPERPVIFECVSAVKRHHPTAKILVVDSASDDKSYLQWCHDNGCMVADIDNRGYAHGAFAWAVRNYHEPFYSLMFDSLIVQSNLDWLADRPVTVTRHWSNLQHDWGWDARGRHLSVWGGEQLARMGIGMPARFHGAMGPMLFAQRSVVDELETLGYWDITIPSSYEHCGLERVCGITLEYLGHDVEAVSLQGVHTTHEAQYDERFVAKRNMARA